MGELGLGRNGEFVCVEIFVFVFWIEGGRDFDCFEF